MTERGTAEYRRLPPTDSSPPFPVAVSNALPDPYLNCLIDIRSGVLLLPVLLFYEVNSICFNH